MCAIVFKYAKEKECENMLNKKALLVIYFTFVYIFPLILHNLRLQLSGYEGGIYLPNPMSYWGIANYILYLIVFLCFFKISVTLKKRIIIILKAAVLLFLAIFLYVGNMPRGEPDVRGVFIYIFITPVFYAIFAYSIGFWIYEKWFKKFSREETKH